MEFAYESPWHILVFLVLLFLVWAMPTHYSARLLLDTDVRFQKMLGPQRSRSIGQLRCRSVIECTEIWAPRLLGLLTFVAVLIAIWRSGQNLPVFDDKPIEARVNSTLVWMAVLVVASAIGFVAYTIWRPHDSNFFLFRILKRFNHRIEPLWRWFSPGNTNDPQGETSRDVGRFLLFALFVTFVVIFLVGPDFAAWIAPRSIAVPVILGGWLPFLSYLSALGRQWRAPLILGLFALVAGLVLWFGDNHAVRRINAAAEAGPSADVSRIPLQKALALWEQENKCTGTPASCPRPIIVAASGGASRAGFFVGTVLGYFMQEADKNGLDPDAVRNRLFAISSVSGSSLGAVMVTKALDQGNGSHFPCAQPSPDLWWGEKINNWRDCFEALISGDFLTADFFGFAFNDMFPLPSFGLVRDRAAVLEDTWKARYKEVVEPAGRSSSPCNKGLDCPFLSLKPRSGHWIPLLVLNGTSEATGGRIVTTPLQPTYVPKADQPCPTIKDEHGGCTLFVEADYFHDLITSGAHGKKPDDGFDDVFLSTAAHNSARFPLISPPGSVRNRDGAIVDRIVDGGYFENSGALGAKELVLAIRAIEPGLAPFVLIVSNDPADPVMPDLNAEPDLQATQKELQKDQQVKVRAAVDGVEPVTDVWTPVMAIINTRSAHGVLGMDELRITLDHALPKCDVNETKIRVWPQPSAEKNGSRAVSMSWWLSPPVQLHLHQQTEPNKSGNHNDDRLQTVWNAMKMTSACGEP